MPTLMGVRSIRDGVLPVRFCDGSEGAVGLSGERERPAFFQLGDPSPFGRLVPDPDPQALVVPNDAGLALDFRREPVWMGRAR